MPLYEYKCTKCGVTFEIIHKVGENPLKKCSNCGGSIKKVISSPAFQFKGSGWYVTDYAKKDRAKTSEKKPVKTADKKEPALKKKEKKTKSQS